MKTISKKPKAASTAGAYAEVRQWLEAFATAVRAQDYARGCSLFADNVVAFGTRATMMQNLDSLTRDQWQPIWGETRGFQFHVEKAKIEIDQNTAWVAVPWLSQGRNDRQEWYDRPGRATYVLRRRGGRWLAVHSHHSLDPQFKAPGEISQ